MFLKIARQGDNHWWQYLVTVVLTVVAMLAFQLPLLFVFTYFYTKVHGPTPDPEELEAYFKTLNYTEIGMGLNLTLVLVLLGFVGGFLALWFFIKNLHNRKLKSLVTPFAKINWRKIFFAFGLWLVFTFIIEAASYMVDPGHYILQFQWPQFVVLLLISLFVLPIQTSFEELFVRGYLMQGIALISKYRWIPLIITSVVFGVLHVANPEVEKFGSGIMMAYYIGTGLFLGIITLMDDSLELALGIHAATNIYSSTVVTFEGSALPTHAIFRTEVVNIELMLLVFFASAIVFTFICWRKYRWKGWHKAFGRVENEQLA